MDSLNIPFVYGETQAGRRAFVSEEPSLARSFRSGIAAPSGSIIVFHDHKGSLNAPDGGSATSFMTITGFIDTVISTGGSISSEILTRALRCHMPIIATA